MKSYKGIDLERNKNLSNYIHTYYNKKFELNEALMECDTGLQNIVRRHYLKKSIYKTMFTLSVWIVLYIGFKLIKG